MSYQVLARKYRPQSFEDMVGQEHVLRALGNGLDQQRLHHAFLFTGTRGVGKTTDARVLARCLNCEQGITRHPCGDCAACRDISAGRFVDLIEVDAASRTRVEDTRDLLENVQYAPSRGRFKIYLIDEVHMLSTHSFNALLKTLEEPPEHVKFLLATTDPQKLPVTVLSRCLQFNLKKLPVELIVPHLVAVLTEEGIEHEARALQRLARAADGSMRDALSLTDQAIAHGAGAVTDASVRDMLGGLGDHSVIGCLQALADNDGAAALREVAALDAHAVDFADVLQALVTALHTLALLQWVPEALDPNDPERDALLALGQRMPPDDVQLYYQIGLHGQADLDLAPEPRSGFEMVLLRMLHFRPGRGPGSVPADPPAAPAGASTGAPPPRAPGKGGMAAAALAAAVGPERREHGATADRRPEPAEPKQTAVPPAIPEGEWPPWPELVQRLALTGAGKALASHCAWIGVEAGVVRLGLAPEHAALRNRSSESRLAEALARTLGAELGLRIESVAEDTLPATPAALGMAQREQRQAAAVSAIDTDPVVQRVRQTFQAEVIPDSVRPVDAQDDDSMALSADPG